MNPTDILLSIAIVGIYTLIYVYLRSNYKSYKKIIKLFSEGFVYAKATNVHLGRTMQIWEVRVTDEDENLISLGKLTTLAINKK